MFESFKTVSSVQTARRPRRKFRLRGASKIAFWFVIIFGGGYLGWVYGVGAYLGSLNYSPPVPGSVSLLSLSPASGYRIKIIDRVAQLQPFEAGSFEATSSNLGLGGGSDGDSRKPSLPLNELIGTLRGDSQSATQFVMALNRLTPEQMDNSDNPEAGWPTVRIPWTAEQIQKALSGDATLQKKLINNLNMNLDGTPLDQVNYQSLESGIIVETPSVLNVTINGVAKKIPVVISRPYRPDMIINVMKTVDSHPSQNFTSDKRLGTYIQFAKVVLAGKAKKEDIRKTLGFLIDPKGLQKYLAPAEQVIDATTVVISNQQIKGATQEQTSVSGDPVYSLELNLTPEGRMRLWKYSHTHHGDQLLLVSHGIAIAAPIIRSDLFTSQISIGEMKDKNLMDDAIASINGTPLSN